MELALHVHMHVRVLLLSARRHAPRQVGRQDDAADLGPPPAPPPPPPPYPGPPPDPNPNPRSASGSSRPTSSTASSPPSARQRRRPPAALPPQPRRCHPATRPRHCPVARRSGAAGRHPARRRRARDHGPRGHHAQVRAAGAALRAWERGGGGGSVLSTPPDAARLPRLRTGAADAGGVARWRGRPHAAAAGRQVLRRREPVRREEGGARLERRRRGGARPADGAARLWVARRGRGRQADAGRAGGGRLDDGRQALPRLPRPWRQRPPLARKRVERRHRGTGARAAVTRFCTPPPPPPLAAAPLPLSVRRSCSSSSPSSSKSQSQSRCGRAGVRACGRAGVRRVACGVWCGCVGCGVWGGGETAPRGAACPASPPQTPLPPLPCPLRRRSSTRRRRQSRGKGAVAGRPPGVGIGARGASGARGARGGAPPFPGPLPSCACSLGAVVRIRVPMWPCGGVARGRRREARWRRGYLSYIGRARGCASWRGGGGGGAGLTRLDAGTDSAALMFCNLSACV